MIASGTSVAVTSRPASSVRSWLLLAVLLLALSAVIAVWLSIDRRDILGLAPKLMLDWCLGTIPVGIALGGVIGFVAYLFARRRDRRELAAPLPPA